MQFILALIVLVLGLLPLAIAKNEKLLNGWAAFLSVVAYIGLTFYFWQTMPMLIWPLGGQIGFIIVIFWLISALFQGAPWSSGYRDESSQKWIWVFPIIGGITFAAVHLFTSPIFNAEVYANALGKPEKRVWTDDTQPKDPHQVRLVTYEYASYLATKELGSVPGAIGSQFNLLGMTLQMHHGRLCYVAPLDYKSYGSWTGGQGAPGYVVVDATATVQTVEVKTGKNYKYMPGAYFGHNLQRHVWQKYPGKGISEYTFQLDEDDNAHWVAPVFEPKIGWSVPKILGVLIIDPETGEDQYFDKDSVPAWVSRVMPTDVVTEYVNDYGQYQQGWWNGFWIHKGVVKADAQVTLSLGSDGQLYEVADLTSNNNNDQSLLGLIYVNARTGASIQYEASGSTLTGAMQAVNNVVKFKNQHASDAVIYNIHGVMSAIVPILGDHKTFQGVGFVDLKTMQVGTGSNPEEAMAAYEKVLANTASGFDADKGSKLIEFTGTVERVAMENGTNEAVYYLYLKGADQSFSANASISPKLRFTQPGDRVEISYPTSQESVVPMATFDNDNVHLQVPQKQAQNGQ